MSAMTAPVKDRVAQVAWPALLFAVQVAAGVGVICAALVWMQSALGDPVSQADSLVRFAAAVWPGLLAGNVAEEIWVTVQTALNPKVADVPATWVINVRRSRLGVGFAGEGFYVDNPDDPRQLVFSGWFLTRGAARQQVSWWIEEEEASHSGEVSR